MRKFIVGLACIASLFGSIRMSADVYQWLTFRFADNSEVSVSTDNAKISYDNGALRVVSANVNETFEMASLKSMQFTSLISGINSPDMDSAEVMTAYNLNGAEAGRFTSVEEARGVLPSGVYVFKGSTKTVKVIF